MRVASKYALSLHLLINNGCFLYLTDIMCAIK